MTVEKMAPKHPKRKCLGVSVLVERDGGWLAICGRQLLAAGNAINTRATLPTDIYLDHVMDDNRMCRLWLHICA